MRYVASIAALFLIAPGAIAHPVTKDHHDRTITVLLHRAQDASKVRILVAYRVEVDEGTVIDRDMDPFKDEVHPLQYRGEPLKYYAKFAEIYAPIYASHMILRVDKKRIESLRCVSRKVRLDDEDGKGLGHLRCDFVFETEIDVRSDAKTEFSFEEKNYWDEDGQIFLSLATEGDIGIDNVTAPDEALWKRVKDRREIRDEARLRKLTLTIVPGSAPLPVKTSLPTPEPDAREADGDPFDLRRLILHNNYGFWLVMLLSFLFGAAHALTPGHGKTLVAAYLVGERGTVWHAMYLGLVTTLTHTGVVIILAIIVTLLPAEMRAAFMSWLTKGLGLVMGLIVACAGFWLLIRRLAGRADHVHLGSGAEHPADMPRSLGWWGITLLGVTGGLIPCWDAILLLGITLGSSEIWLVLPAVLVFSAGLAAVLVVIGILVVQVPRFVESRFGSGRLLRALPIVSAILVTLMGLWLCYEGVHGK